MMLEIVAEIEAHGKFWIPAVGNGQLGQFLAHALKLGLIRVPNWSVDADNHCRRTPPADAAS